MEDILGEFLTTHPTAEAMEEVVNESEQMDDSSLQQTKDPTTTHLDGENEGEDEGEGAEMEEGEADEDQEGNTAETTEDANDGSVPSRVSQEKLVCVVPDCPNYQQNTPEVHAFPDGDEKPLVRRKWLFALNTSRAARNKPLDLVSLKQNPHFGLCVKHFNRQTDFDVGEDGKLTLKNDAVPSIFPVPQTILVNAAGNIPMEKSSSNSSRSLFARKSISNPPLKKSSTGQGEGGDEEEDDEVEGDDTASDEAVDGGEMTEGPSDSSPGSKRGRSDKGELERRRQLVEENVSVYRYGSPQKVGTNGGMTTTIFLPKSVVHGPLPAVEEVTSGSSSFKSEDEIAPGVVARSGSATSPLQRGKLRRKPPALGIHCQVEEDQLDPDESDEEIQEILHEAQSEIMDLKFALEESQADLAAERHKVAHLESRVNAWIRAHFTAQTLDAERLDTLNQVAQYYLDHARKGADSSKNVHAELELYRANFLRSQKETESYRLQIIELQGASTRELDRLQIQKTKNEKEAAETIHTLRRQLADSAVAAEHAKRAQLAAEESLRRVIGEGNVPSRAASQVIVVASGTQQSTPSTSPPKTPRFRAPRGSKKKEASVKKSAEEEAHSTHNEAVKLSLIDAAQALAAAEAVAEETPKATLGRGRKRGRPPGSTTKKTVVVVEPPAPSAAPSATQSPAKRTRGSAMRETSVDRAVRYLMSL
ncbi:hypothetical protein RvY_02264 [Ramazzottius varieornatus]|uniref:THAP-type domain-containing protein n=1 Tax=Ramazzottius varieornatus TaxID=947166 RepID=A0A1D1UTP9_RAMVA|nr:hypothetical protein RvY_02264 [Ramazzottius varieornatus]